MAIGPVRCSYWVSEAPDFHGEIIAELERRRESDLVRVIDSLAVYKDARHAAGAIGTYDAAALPPVRSSAFCFRPRSSAPRWSARSWAGWTVICGVACPGRMSRRSGRSAR
jgi:hypothetical protein